MEFDRDLGIQVGLSVAVVALFIVGLILLSGAYGFTVDVTEEPLDGTIEGTYEVTDGAVDEDGPVTVSFLGTFENDIEVTFNGTIDGEIADEQLTGAYNGTVAGAIDGTATGTVTNGTFDTDQDELTGDFSGTAEGTTSMDLTDEGGLVLIGLMVAFIILMPAVGFLIERLRSDDD